VLFLDEVSEMTLSAQAKLLRVLQEREVQRLGGLRPVRVNIRVVAATNRDLAATVERGTFRGGSVLPIERLRHRDPPVA
jgi:Nif-specific regulatory protein